MAGIPEAEVSCVVISRVVYPHNVVKTNQDLFTENTVQEEKSRLLEEAGIANPDQYVMVLCSADGSQILMEDSRAIEFYVANITSNSESEIHVQEIGTNAEHPKSGLNSQTNSQGNGSNLDVYNVKVKSLA